MSVLYNSYRVCSLHFESNMYSGPVKNRLLPSAIPNLKHGLFTERKLSGELQNTSTIPHLPKCQDNDEPLSKRLRLLSGKLIKYISLNISS